MSALRGKADISFTAAEADLAGMIGHSLLGSSFYSVGIRKFETYAFHRA